MNAGSANSIKVHQHKEFDFVPLHKINAVRSNKNYQMIIIPRFKH